MIRKELSARAANILRAAASTTACTLATVESLRSFLTNNGSPIPQKCQQPRVPAKIAPPKKAASRATSVKAVGARARKQLDVAILELAAGDADIITAGERLALATEVANVTLKALTEAIKKPLPQRKRTPLARSSSNASFNNGLDSRSQTPLQSISVNRMTASPGKHCHSRRSSSNASTKEALDGLRAQAECARIAYATLRSLYSTSELPKLPYLQLESGMSALITKLIVLGLDDLAVKELRILRRRLESQGDIPPRISGAPTEMVLENDRWDPKGESLPSMLRFRNHEAKGLLLTLTIASQLHVLKIIILRRDVSAVGLCLQHLGTDFPHSPVNLIRRQIDPDAPGSQAKVARQLESFAQLLLNMCNLALSADNKIKQRTSESLLPEVTFQLQLLALQIRHMWWELSGHQCNVSQEMINPFSRYMTNFARNSKLEKKAKYDIAQSAMHLVSKLVQNVKGFQEEMFLDTYQSLAVLAQSACEHAEAVRWIGKSKKHARQCKVSQIQQCILACRSATLQFRATDSTSDAEILGTLQDAADTIGGDLQGGSAELDELLPEVACLRKGAFLVVQDSYRLSPTNISVLAHTCRNIVLLCLKFMIRYVGNGPGLNENEKTAARRKQRKSLAARFAGPAVESVVALSNSTTCATPDTWKVLDAGLRDCLELLTRLAGSDIEAASALKSSKKSTSCFVSVSNAYWYRFLRLKQGVRDGEGREECLKRSIEILKDRPISDKIDGHLALKLEKRGQIFEALHKYRKAADVYEEALLLQIETGNLQEAAKAAAMSSLLHVFETAGDHGTLSRMLLAYPTTALKIARNEKQLDPIFDPKGLCDSESGILLEQQLGAIMLLISDRARSESTCRALDDVAKSLLSRYTSKNFPVRRLRVVVRLLGLSLTNPKVLRNETQDLILQDYEILDPNAHFDAELLPYVPHLLHSRNVLISLRDEIPNVELLGKALDYWSLAVREFLDWNSLHLQIYDYMDWLKQLDLLADYLEMKGLDLLRVSVLDTLVRVHDAEDSILHTALVTRLSALGTQYSRMGYPGQAILIFHKAQNHIKSSSITASVTLRWRLAYAECSLVNGDPNACKQNLAEARKLYNSAFKLKSGSVGAQAFSEQAQLVADACYLLSLTAQAEGKIAETLFYARMSVKNYNQSWTILAHRYNANDRIAREISPETVNDSSMQSMSELAISECQPKDEKATLYSALRSVDFWRLVPRLFQGLIHLSSVYARFGLIPEVLYYLGQARKIAEAVHAPGLIARCCALMGRYRVCQGETVEGASLLRHVEQLLPSMQHDRNFVVVQSMLASSLTQDRETEAAEATFAVAEKLLEQLTTAKFLDSLIDDLLKVDDLDKQMQLLNLEEAQPPRQTKSGRSASKKPSTKLAVQQKPSRPAQEVIPVIERTALNQLKGEICRAHVSTLLSKGLVDRAAALVEKAAVYPCDQGGVVLQTLLTSRIHFLQGLDNLATDPVLCVLHESTISCPSISVSGGLMRRSNVSHKPIAGTKHTVPVNPRTNHSAKKSRARSPSIARPEAESLRLVHVGLRDVLQLARQVSSTMTIHEITDILGKTLAILSAAPSSPSRKSVPASLIAYVLELGRTLSMDRECASIRVERALLRIKDAHQWPADFDSENSEVSVQSNRDWTVFQEELIDIMPPSWTAISITLTDTHEELLICKIRSGQTPFVLRLPLGRQKESLDMDDEGFSFDQGRAELRQIISLANRSTHGAEELSHKGAKTAWWEARQTLDARLQDLLHNMETIWFGGFKGVFSQDCLDGDLLLRLQKSLQSIFDKHLPSRQKSGKGRQSSRVALDLRVMELFVGLGAPSEVNDIDEPLLDLLYFAVDILQFNGERNAYDEVDFDSMTVETIDALRQYHQIFRDQECSGTKQHTILILDRHLHCFPWESLPCLNGKPVSRLPSLGCLREKILFQQKKQEESGSRPVVEDSIQVSRHDGTWIMNPGGDLKATQERLEQPLEGLVGWDSIVQREPSETEMTSCLEDHEILLYFGHGSGGQYIRSRIIKRLDKCAVALLMGCSSGALTEAGDFESYGTPMNYMHAGCPALLATLWDVTDKDIDKFSYKVLEDWGLFQNPQPQNSPVKKIANQRGKSKVEEVESVTEFERSPVSLDEAVATGRRVCNLRYLNGAAPVVYGVPVYIA